MQEPSFNAEPEEWYDFADYLEVEVEPGMRRDAVRKIVMTSPEFAEFKYPATDDDLPLSDDELLALLIAQEAVDAVDVDPDEV